MEILKVTKINRRKWKVLEAWDAKYGIVNADFESDGASIPWYMLWLMRPAGDLFEAAIFHDHCYKYATKTKSFADKAFYNIALNYGCPKWKAKLAYIGVKIGGKGKY